MKHYVSYWGGNLYFLPHPLLCKVFDNESSEILTPARLADGWKVSLSTWLISEGKLYLTFLVGEFADGESFSLDEAYADGSNGIFLKWFTGTVTCHSDMFDAVDDDGHSWACHTGVNFNFENGLLRNFSVTHLESDDETVRSREYTKRLATERLTLANIDSLGSIKGEILEDIRALKNGEQEWSNSHLEDFCAIYAKSALLDILNIYYFEGFCFQPVCLPISFEEAFSDEKSEEIEEGNGEQDEDEEDAKWTAETHLSDALESLNAETVEFWLNHGLTLHDYSGSPQGIAWQFFKKINDIYNEYSEESCALGVDKLRALQESLELVLQRLDSLDWFEQKGVVSENGK